MKTRMISLLLACAILLGLCILPPAAQAADLQKSYGMVRVYLSSMGKVTTVNIKPYGNYTVNGQAATLLEQMEDMKVTLSGGKLYLERGTEKTALGTQFTLKRHGSADVTNMMKIKVGSSYYNYPADVLFKIVSGYIQVIVRLNIEDYLYGVLPHEMSNSWPMEALKAQAVNARTYIARKMVKTEPNYEVVDTSTDQVFRGVNTKNNNCIAAVNATKGQILTYGNDVAYAYYGDSNGGQTELPGNIWGGGNRDYHVMKDDPYDFENPSSKLKTAMVKKDLGSGSNATLKAKILAAAKKELAGRGYSTEEGDWSFVKILKAEAVDRKYAEPSRAFKNFQFTVSAKAKNAEGKTETVQDIVFKLDFYNDLKSSLNMSHQSKGHELISVSETSSQVTLEARRWGHGVGMSQRGAQTMAKFYNKSYRDILKFYFPDLSLTKLDVARDEIPEVPERVQETPAPGETPKPTEEAKPTGEYAVVNLSSRDSNLTFREGPSYSTTLLGYLNHGMVLPVVGYDGDWVRMSYQGKLGYSHKNYLIISKNPNVTPKPQQTSQTMAPTTTPSPTATAKPGATPSPTPSGVSPSTKTNQTGAVRLSSDASQLKFRNQPSTEGAVISYLRNNQVVAIIELFDGWYQVAAVVNGRETTGYVSMNYVEPIEKYTAQVSASSGTNALDKPASGAKVVNRVGFGTKLETVAVGAKWSLVKLGSNTGYIRNSALKLTQTK